ncbi:MAG: Na/Pi symporter [Victivallales bacterium]|nr:Na/Pi symporter [Victivallales bacterium]
MLSLMVGCGNVEEKTPDVISVMDGASQTAKAGEMCEEELLVLVRGAKRRGKLGGAVNRHPAVGVKVRISSSSTGAFAEPSEGLTDKGGNFRCKLHLARQFGDQYFVIDCPDFPDVKPFYVHTVAGVTIKGANQETIAGDDLPEPIQLLITDDEGKPIANMPVNFKISKGSEKAKLSSARVISDATGHASVGLHTDDDFTGAYEVIAEVGEEGARTRGISIRVLAINRLNIIIGILGGLGIFIFGMSLMSEGLQQLAGDKLKGLLQMFTSNQFKAMMAGLVVTSLIQSSGACTVMVVGFVNAALLNLEQAIGIIFGASIGTTITAQMVSFRLDNLALPSIAVGVVCLLLAKKSRSKGIASTILGFGLLFYGMMTMSAELKTISQFPTFMSYFQMFDCTPKGSSNIMPFWNVICTIVVGVIMTIIVQSSSATVGLAIAMADSGLLNFYTSIPFIFGCNIGSTVTGLFAALNTNRASKQAAVAATLHKILGVLIMMPLLYINIQARPIFLQLADVLTPGDVFAFVPENIGRHLANAHTLFNIFNVVLFLPFIKLLAWISKIVVPERANGEEAKDSICHLEQRLLNTPSAALAQVFNAILSMTEVAMDLTSKSIHSIAYTNEANEEEEIEHIEERIDNAQHAIIDYLVLLTRRNLNITQSASIPIFMHCVNDIERIGDRAVNIYQLLPPMKAKELSFSAQAVAEIVEINEHLNKMKNLLTDGLRNKNMDEIQKVLAMNAEVKFMTARFERSHEARLKALDCTVEKGVVFVELLSNLERISAHLGNIAERANEILPHSVSFNTANTRK